MKLWIAKLIEQSGIVVILGALLYVALRAYDRSNTARIAAVEKSAEQCQKDRARAPRVHATKAQASEPVDRLPAAEG